MNIDFIKWLVKKAEGFKLDDGIMFIDDLNNGTPIGHIWYHRVVYPLLLQRAIEGVNREDHKFQIVQWVEQLDVTTNDLDCKQVFYANYADSIDQAKESALKYIWEQETK